MLARIVIEFVVVLIMGIGCMGVARLSDLRTKRKPLTWELDGVVLPSPNSPWRLRGLGSAHCGGIGCQSVVHFDLGALTLCERCGSMWAGPEWAEPGKGNLSVYMGKNLEYGAEVRRNYSQDRALAAMEQT